MSVTMPRRDFLIQGSAAATAAALFVSSGRPGVAFPMKQGGSVIPWLDQPDPNPDPVGIQNQLVWEELDSWITPTDKFFSISHFDRPEIDATTWALEIDGLVDKPLRLTLADLKARPKQDVAFTIECSGNHGFPFFTGGIGNARWSGTPLHMLLQEAGVKPSASEVVFWAADAGDIVLKDQIRDVSMHQHFARSMSLNDASAPENLLCYEMNGEALPKPNGFPLRLIAPGWYGIANVKWLTRIEVRDRRFMSLLMARDYVTIREEEHNGETVWAETSVGRTRLKSAPAKVVRFADGVSVVGAAWGAPIDAVEVKVDDGPWRRATLDGAETAKYAWVLWSIDFTDLTPGEHSVTSRAIDTTGAVQPAMDDPWIARKHTYWESNGQVTRRVKL